MKPSFYVRIKVIKLGEVEVGSLAIKNINQGSMEAEREGTVLRF